MGSIPASRTSISTGSIIVVMHSLPDLATTHRQLLHVHGVASESTLVRCFDGVATACIELQLNEADTMAVQLITDEVCTNITMHGYPGREPGPLALTLWQSVGVSPGELVLDIRDEGEAFNSDDVAAPDLDADVEERRIGGLGWFLVKQMSSLVQHTHIGGVNTTRLTRKMGGQTQ